jgi:hypothetical protein
MAHGDGNARIRQVAWSEFIEPQIKQGKAEIILPIKPLMKRLEAEGFPKNRPRQFCTAPQEGAFLEAKNLILDHVEGPPSGNSTTVILHFRFSGEFPSTVSSGSDGNDLRSSPGPDPLLELQGILKGAIVEGAKAFLHELRRDHKDPA